MKRVFSIEKLGQLIRDRVYIERMTQSQLAERLVISKATVSRVLAGKDPSAEVLILLLAWLDIDWREVHS
jgi:transcriptional regulator with XRE-family HTH domain